MVKCFDSPEAPPLRRSDLRLFKKWSKVVKSSQKWSNVSTAQRPRRSGDPICGYSKSGLKWSKVVKSGQMFRRPRGPGAPAIRADRFLRPSSVCICLLLKGVPCVIRRNKGLPCNRGAVTRLPKGAHRTTRALVPRDAARCGTGAQTEVLHATTVS